MPVGATIGAAVVGAGAGIYSSSQASKAQTNAANTAANDQLAVASQNNALTTNMYNSNAARLDPYSALGLPAGGEYNALLGIASPAAASPNTAPPALPPVDSGAAAGGPSLQDIQAMQHDGIPHNYANAMAAYNSRPTPAIAAAPTAAPATTNQGSAPGPVPVSPNNAMAGFNTFYNSPTYQFPLQQGLKAVNTNYAAKGALESGAAMKAIDTFGANSASGALGTYLDNLYRQESLGMSASSALAGVGQNMVGQISANNNNAASAAGNAALVAGQGSANNWNALGSGIGQIAGSVAGAMGSSYHPSNALAYNMSQPVPVNIPTAQPYASLPGGFYGG